MIYISITNCIICKKTFEYKYYKKMCCCDKCLSEYRKQLSLKQHALNYDKVIGKIFNYIKENYDKDGIVKTLQECIIECHIAPKTFYKYCKEYNTSYNKILSSLGIFKCHSKFQNNVTKYIQMIFKDYQIITEYSFADCVNPQTGYCLKFDIFIPKLNVLIECNGEQHEYEDYYFNKLVVQNGHTPVYITDKIKKQYCCENNIILISIPYNEVVTKEYVEKYISDINIIEPYTTIVEKSHYDGAKAETT